MTAPIATFKYVVGKKGKPQTRRKVRTMREVQAYLARAEKRDPIDFNKGEYFVDPIKTSDHVS
jgi:hypothetical protein